MKPICEMCEGSGEYYTFLSDRKCDICHGAGRATRLKQFIGGNTMLHIKRKIIYLAWKITHFWMYFNAKNLIPKNTCYCYIITGPFNGNSIPVDTCPFHKYYTWDLCMYNGSDCVMDSCKTCGINDDWEVEDDPNQDIQSI
jgi:hypothetical protein